MFFEIIKTLSSLKSVFTSIRDWILFLKKNGCLNASVVASLFVMAGLGYYLFIIISGKSDKFYQSYKRREIIERKIDQILKECGDKTGLTLVVVSIEKPISQDFWDGGFEIAKACDTAAGGDCIINLKTLNPQVYNKNYLIDASTYSFLNRIGSLSIPSYFSLRDSNGVQNLDQVILFPALSKVLEGISWYKSGLLDSIWITSILNSRDKVLFGISLLAGKDRLACPNPNSVLQELKEFIEEQNGKY